MHPYCTPVVIQVSEKQSSDCIWTEDFHGVKKEEGDSIGQAHGKVFQGLSFYFYQDMCGSYWVWDLLIYLLMLLFNSSLIVQYGGK